MLIFRGVSHIENGDFPSHGSFFLGGEGVLFSTRRRLVHRWPFSQVQVLQEHVKSNIVKESHGTS